MSSLQETSSAHTGADLLDCSRYGELGDVEAILLNGVDANHQDAHGNTALHLSCANGHADVIRALIKAGAEHLPNAAGNRPLQWAVQNKHVSCVKLLVELYPDSSQINVLDKNGVGKSALTDAFRTGDAEMVKLVLNHKSAEEDMLLSQSSLSKDKQNAQGNAEALNANGASDEQAAASDSSSGGAAANLKPSESSGGKGQAGVGDNDGSGPSITHELGFGVGMQEDGDDDEEGVTFFVRELPIRNPDDCFGEDAREDTTGLNLWAAAVVLGRWMASPAIQARLDGKTLLELGAGCGAGGISAAVHGRPTAMLLSDLNVETMANLAHNIELNRPRYCTESEVRAVTLDWGDESTWEAAAPPVDVVLAADLVYQATETSPLLHAIFSLLKPGGTFFHVCPVGERDGLEDFLTSLGVNAGGDETAGGDGKFELVSARDAPPEYSQNPLISGSEEEYMLHFNEMPRTTFRLHELRKRL